MRDFHEVTVRERKMEKIYKNQGKITEVITPIWGELKAKGWTQQKLANKLEITQPAAGRIVNGWQAKAGQREPYPRSPGQLIDFCNVTNTSLAEFDIVNEESVLAKAKFLYLATVSAKGEETGTPLGIKYGVTKTTPEQRLVEVNTQKPQFNHRLFLSVEFAGLNNAAAAEDALVKEFGKEPPGEYVYARKDDVWPHLIGFIKYLKHEVKYY